MRFDGFVLAVDPHPEPARRWPRRGPTEPAANAGYGIRSGLAFAVLTAPRVNAAAWFALAVAAPLALLAAAAAVTMSGPAQLAGLCAAALLAPAILWAAKAVEVRRFRPVEACDPALTRAFCLTTGPACALLLLVVLGAPLGGQAVAVGLAMAATPLTAAVVGRLRRDLFRTAQATSEPARDWVGEWAAIERAISPPAVEPESEPELAAAPVLPFPKPRAAREPVAARAAGWETPRRRAAGRN